MASGQNPLNAQAAAQRATGGMMTTNGSGRGSQRERTDINNQFGPGINNK